MELITANLGGNQARREELNGRVYWVRNVTTIVPGVLNGSRGPLLYPSQEVVRNYDAWNGMPMVHNHPTQNGKPVSARKPKVLKEFGLGYVYETVFNGKLQHEAWFDEELTEKHDRSLPEADRMLPRVKRGDPIEVSTGLYTENQPAEGVHNGRNYKFIARNYRPDHLAILPQQKGACSVEDGCGVNNAACEVVDGLCVNCGGKGGTKGPCPKNKQQAQKGVDKAKKKVAELAAKLKAAKADMKAAQAALKSFAKAKAEKPSGNFAKQAKELDDEVNRLVAQARAGNGRTGRERGPGELDRSKLNSMLEAVAKLPAKEASQLLIDVGGYRGNARMEQWATKLPKKELNHRIREHTEGRVGMAVRSMMV